MVLFTFPHFLCSVLPADGPSATIILLQTAPIGFAEVSWKYFLVVICWSAIFIPLVYFYWPETARLSLEEIGQQFGDEVAVHLIDATDEEKAAIDQKLQHPKDAKGSDDSAREVSM